MLAGLVTLLAKATGRPRAEIRVDLDLLESGDLDSLSSAEFLLAAERQFGVRIPDWVLGGEASTLEALAAFVHADREGR